MEKEIVTLMLEPGQYPILLTDYDDRTTYTGIDIIDNDPIVRDLNIRFGELYSSCYETDSHDLPMWFNAELYTKIYAELKSLGKQLIDRLNELNDGSYEVIDKFSKFI